MYNFVHGHYTSNQFIEALSLYSDVVRYHKDECDSALSKAIARARMGDCSCVDLIDAATGACPRVAAATAGNK